MLEMMEIKSPPPFGGVGQAVVVEEAILDADCVPRDVSRAVARTIGAARKKARTAGLLAAAPAQAMTISGDDGRIHVCVRISGTFADA